MKELEAKLDRLELEPFKDYIEKQLRKIKKLQVKISKLTEKNELIIIFEFQKETHQAQMDDENAAGMRRPYLRFNCISCDRPIDAAPQQ